MTDFITILCGRRGHALHVTFNRPEALNGMTMVTFAELDRVCRIVEEDEEVRVVVFRGQGKAFSVGADIEMLTDAFADRDAFLRFIGAINRVLLRIESLPVPTIAAVNGLARAGGFELILTCDLVIAAEEARIGDNHTNFGLMPGGGATYRAARRLGEMRARELIFTAGWLSGAEAAAAGLCLRAVPLDRLDAEVEELVSRIVDKPRDALAATKRALEAGRGLTSRQGFGVEMSEFFALLETSSAPAEGFNAYLEKRPPSWAAAR